MKTIAVLDVGMSIQLENALNHYAEVLVKDAELYARHGNEALADATRRSAVRLKQLALDIDCDPIRIVKEEYDP